MSGLVKCIHTMRVSLQRDFFSWSIDSACIWFSKLFCCRAIAFVKLVLIRSSAALLEIFHHQFLIQQFLMYIYCYKNSYYALKKYHPGIFSLSVLKASPVYANSKAFFAVYPFIDIFELASAVYFPGVHDSHSRSLVLFPGAVTYFPGKQTVIFTQGAIRPCGGMWRVCTNAAFSIIFT